ncbi:MAG TPA: tetratricopeptide repeat protein [Kofleriaceae bacterium]
MKKSPLIALLLAGVAGVASGQPGNQPTPVPQDPATGPGLGQPTAAPAGALQLSPQELEELKAVEADYEDFLQAAKNHDARLRQIARHEYNSRTAELEKRYAERIANAESDQGKRLLVTKERLEKFLVDHPKHETFTPDARFRLADLYLDEADAEVDRRLAEADKMPPDPNRPDAAAIIADYSKSLEQWEAILKEFPNYRQTPSTIYLLAYYGKTKDERRSLQLFLALACANRYKWNDKPPAKPDQKEAIKRVESKTLREVYGDCQPYPNADVELIRHAWVRGIADYHFAVAGEIDDAIAAYTKVTNGGQDSKLYAEALYKLAWSYYKRDFLKESIDNFDKSVVLYDTTVTAGNTPPLELRDESIQYIAVAFTDPWNGETDTDPTKAFTRAKDFYKGRENEPHVRDVWVAMGQAFEDLQAWDQAVDSYRIAIGPPWELNPKNPVVHQKIVNAFESKGDKFAADKAAGELATKYAPGTAWYAANEKDREAMENQRRIAERALYAAARNTHSAATQLRKDYEAGGSKDAALKQEYLAMYNQAVEMYRQFISTYPESDYMYEFNFLLGETLFYGERYREAIVQYKWVRDHRDLGQTYYLDAARSVLASYEAAKDKEVAEGKLQPLKVPTVAELKTIPQPWQPQPIPALYLELQAEYDNYQNIVQDPAAAPGQGINAALISLAYFHVDDAIARFTKVMDKFCSAAPAKKGELAPAAKAKDGILAIYEAQGNFDAIEATNKRFINAKCGDDNAIQLAMNQNRSLNFSRAAELFKQQKFIPAAEAFYRFYKTAQQTDPDLPVALYNAAVSYKLADRPKTAIGLFKEFTSRPEKNFRESPYYLDAMRLTAASQQASFQYDEAIKTYLSLYETTKTAKKKGIQPPAPLPGEKPLTLEQIGLDAVYNAAYAAEVSRDFKRAVTLYGQYQGIEPDRRKQDRAQWSIAGIHRQSGDINAMTSALDKWRGKFGKDPGNEDDYVKTFYDTAEANRKKGRTPQAKAAEKQTIEAWKQRGAVKNTPGAKMAAEYALKEAEEFYDKTWAPFEIKTAATSTNINTAKKQITDQQNKIADLRKQAEDKYIGLDVYGVLETTMAAKVRFGDIQYDRAMKIGNIPIPKIIQNNDAAISAFETQRDAALKKDLDEARLNWAEVADLAKKGGVSNQWSQKALENLAREFPEQYKALRQELVQGTDAP